MHVHAFRFDTSRLHAAFAPRKPRNPLLRIGVGLLGLVLLAVLLVGGLFVGIAMLAVGLALRLAKGRTRPVPLDPRVVEGEYRVVDRPALRSR